MPIDLTTTNLSGKDMSNRDLRGVSFARMRCMRANFSGSDLRGADFREADCTGADFSGAQLEGADFTDAILDGVTMPEGIGETIIAKQQRATIEAAPLVRVKVLEEDNKRLEDDNILLRQQLDDALAEIKRLQQMQPIARAFNIQVDPALPEGTIQAVSFDGSTATLNNIAEDDTPERPVRRRRSKAQE